MAQDALLYKSLKEKDVQCGCCAHRCYLKPGEKGKCLVRYNQEGILKTLAYGNLIAQHVDPIEKKPLYHFYPGSLAYSIAIAGCNFSCQWCQNWEISQLPRLNFEMSGINTSPDEVVKRTLAQQCTSIAYTYTEPTIFFEYSYETSKLARNAGLKNIYVTNGYMTEEMLDLYHPWLDAANVDIKAFSDATYQKYIGAHLRPVLETCSMMKKKGIWLEITTLIIPGINDDLSEIRDLASYIRNELGEGIPWHISRYYPNYNFQNIPATPIKTLKQIEAIGKEAGLNYVYIGNASPESVTKCPKCGEILIRRWGSQIVLDKVTKESTCPKCDFVIEGVGLSIDN
jgi:pyruvate formate lyase activating enzyme